MRHFHRRRVFSYVVEFRLEDVGVLDHVLLFGGGHLVGGDVGGRFGRYVAAYGCICTACTGGQSVGTFVPPRAGGTVFIKFLLAFV